RRAMPVERRERVIAIWLGSTGNGRNPMFNGRRQPSRGGTSRMMRECQVRFCERLGVKFRGPTRQSSVGCRPSLKVSGERQLSPAQRRQCFGRDVTKRKGPDDSPG